MHIVKFLEFSIFTWILVSQLYYGVPFVSKFTFTRHTDFRGNLTPRTVDIY